MKLHPIAATIHQIYGTRRPRIGMSLRAFLKGWTVYPLNMTHAALGGFAVANDEAEHQSLSDAGYEPKYVAPEKAPRAKKPAQE